MPALAIRLERARLRGSTDHDLNMFDLRYPVVWLIGILALAGLLVVARRRFNPEARARRRRNKSNRPLISTKRGPAVRLAVSVDKPKSNRKG